MIDTKNKPSCIFRNFEFFRCFLWVKYFRVIGWDLRIILSCIHKEIMMYKSHPMTRKYQTHEKHLKTQNFEKYMMVYFSYLSCGTVCRFLALNSQFKILWFLMNFTDLIIRRFPFVKLTAGILTWVEGPSRRSRYNLHNLNHSPAQ